MDEALLPCVELEPEGPVRHSIVWLHGLGADGHDFEPIVPELRLPRELGVRFVFPHAPEIPVTLNAGMVMRAWYDIRDLDLRRRHDEQGILASSRALTRLIERENERGVPCERVFLAGFSQGGAVAAHVALRHPAPLAGLIALSTYLVREEALAAERSAENRALRVFQAHGTYDPMVVLARGAAAHERLVQLGYDVEWRTYPMEHQVCLEELQDLSAWIKARCAAR